MKSRIVSVALVLALAFAIMPSLQGAYADTPTTTLSIGASHNFTVTNAEGQYFRWEDGVITGTMKVYGQRILADPIQVQAIVDTSPSYTLKSDNNQDNLFHVTGDDVVALVEASKDKSITIGTDKGVGYARVNGKKTTYTIMLGLQNNGSGGVIFSGRSKGSAEARDTLKGVALTGANDITSLLRNDSNFNEKSLKFIPYRDPVVFSSFTKKPFKVSGAVVLSGKESKVISNVRSYRIADDAIMLTWAKVKAAKGYNVYRYDSQKKAFRKVKTINGKEYVMYVDRGLSLNTAYRYKVRPFALDKGKKKAGKASYYVRSVTQSSTRANAAGVTASKKSVKGKAGTKLTLTAKVTAAPGMKLFDSSVRWFSKDRRIASVTSSGKLTLKAKGSTYVRAKAHNGMTASVKVVVK